MTTAGFLDNRADLRDKVAVIVGGGGGIGAAVTLALAGAGVHVAFCDIDEAAMAATQASALALGVRAWCAPADVCEPQQLDDFYAGVARWSEQLDIVVNVAGGVRQRPFMTSTRERDLGDMRRNFGYVVDSVRHGAALMQRGNIDGKKGGSIINFTTIEAHRGAAGFSVYAGAKAATANFTRAMAVELGAAGIRVNCIAPDTTLSKGNATALPEETLAAMAQLPAATAALAMAMYIPVKTPPDTDALANAVLFLASALSRFVTGTTLHVDGGTWAASGFIDWPDGDGFLPVPGVASLTKLATPKQE